MMFRWTAAASALAMLARLRRWRRPPISVAARPGQGRAASRAGTPCIAAIAVLPSRGRRPRAACSRTACADAPPAPGHIALNYLIGNVDPAGDPVFARIPDEYIGGSRVWGHKDAVRAFVRMAEAAAANGYKLKVVSAFRSFDDQKQIWEDKWTGKTPGRQGEASQDASRRKGARLKILEFSSMPGTSRHHWGTDFDLNSLNNSYFRTVDGKRVYDWLTQHAAEYGFCQVYSAKGADRPTGYEEEKWHWSYMPVASWYLKQYPIDVGYDRLTGFEGAAVGQGHRRHPKLRPGHQPGVQIGSAKPTRC